MDLKDAGFDTKLIHAGEIEDQFGSATVPFIKHQPFAFKVPNTEPIAFQMQAMAIFILG